MIRANHLVGFLLVLFTLAYLPLQAMAQDKPNIVLELPHFCGQFTAFESSHF